MEKPLAQNGTYDKNSSGEVPRRSADFVLSVISAAILFQDFAYRTNTMFDGTCAKM